MEIINGGAPVNAEILNTDLQHEIYECEIIICELESKSTDSSYSLEDLQFLEMLENFGLEYDHFINIEIWSVRKMLPDEFYDQRGLVMVHYLYALISRNADYYNKLYGFDKSLIAKELFNYVKNDEDWTNIDYVLTEYLENLELPDEHAAVMNEYKKWVDIIG